MLSQFIDENPYILLKGYKKDLSSYQIQNLKREMAKERWLIALGFLILGSLTIFSYVSLSSQIGQVSSSGNVQQTVQQAGQSVVLIVTPDGSKGVGFAMSKDGYILTANHVIADFSTADVTLQDGSILTASVYATNVENSDLAILKVNHTLIPMNFVTNSSKIESGTQVDFIGYPTNALNQNLRAGTIAFSGSQTIILNSFGEPGDSGSPVFLSNNGQVLGIVHGPAIQINISQLSIPNNTFTDPQLNALAQLIVQSHNSLASDIQQTYESGLVVVTPVDISVMSQIPSQ